MTVTVVIGMFSGDEAKGAHANRLASQMDAVVRYQGGNNSGHTIVIRGEKTVLHLIPSGILQPGVDCYLSRGMVINPDAFIKEIDDLKEKGVDLKYRLFISKKAPLIMPWHMEIDALREKGAGAIGTTKRGIGPCYEQFVARQAILAEDLFNPEDAIQKIEMFYRERHAMMTSLVEDPYQEFPKTREFYIQEAVNTFKENYDQYAKLLPFICDVERDLRERIRMGDNILLEGAQGTFLDVGVGTYPYVTSSHTTSGGACVGAGIAPRDINKVVGISKAYTTRVGDGPFVTEIDLDSEVGKHLQDVGKEYGATTGRPRRCGWLDLVSLKEAIEINGCTSIVLTKLDVFSGLSEVKVAVSYSEEGKPVYLNFEGWTEDISECRSYEELPIPAQQYLQFINSFIAKSDCYISEVSVGPERSEYFQLDLGQS